MIKEDDSHFGVSLFIASKSLKSPHLNWFDTEILIKPYFVYTAIFALQVLELGGNFCIWIEDT